MNESDLLYKIGQLDQSNRDLKGVVKELTSSVNGLSAQVFELRLWKTKLMATSAAISFIVACLFELAKLYVLAAK